MIQTRQLQNGATVIIEEIPHVRSAAVGVFIKLGSRNETLEVNGISHFIEHMLFKGTMSRTARDIAEVFEEMGGQLNAYTSKEYTCFHARVLDEHTDLAMDILFDMLFNSTMTEKDINTEREVIIEEINMYEDSPDELVHDIFAQTILAGHPLGRSILGTLENIQEMSRDTVFNYYRDHYHPANMIIAIAGNVESEHIFDRIETYSGYGPKYQKAVTSTVTQQNQGVTLVPKDTEQVQICLGVPGISYLDERRYTQNIMNSILGGGISSRLFQTIREEKGLAYSVYSYPSTYRDFGTYAIYVGTGPAKVQEFFTLLQAEINRFVDEGVTSEEVIRSQNQVKASLYLGMESIMARMNRIGKSLLLYDEVVPVEKVIEKIYRVTPEMVKNYARETLGSYKYSLATIGEASVLPEVEKGFNLLVTRGA